MSGDPARSGPPDAVTPGSVVGAIGTGESESDESAGRSLSGSADAAAGSPSENRRDDWWGGALPWIGAGGLALLGGAAALSLSSAPPQASGARRLLAPTTLLAIFDAWWVLALVWPRRGSASARALAAVLLLAVGAPFHAAIAAAAAASGGHASALLVMLLVAGFVGWLVAARPVYAVALGLGLFGLPLVGYALTEFARVDALWMVRASPVTGLVLLAHRAPGTVLADALPAVATLSAVALLSFPAYARGSGGGATKRAVTLVVTAAVLGVAAVGPAQAADGVETYFDGLVRAGRPVPLRVPGARRVRAHGGPWALPMGAAGDEFLLLGATIAGDTLRIEVDRGDADRGGAETGGVHTGNVVHTIDVAVHPIPTDARMVARLGPGRLEADEIAVRPEELPTLREAWLVFDGVVAIPPALPAAQRAALAAYAPRGVLAFPFEPTLLPASPDAFRVTAAGAAQAPRLPRRTARALAVLAVLELLLLLLLARRRAPPSSPAGGAVRSGIRRDVAFAIGAPLLALAWCLASEALPGPVRATAFVIEGAADALVLIRLEAASDATLVIEPPDGASPIVPVRWSTSDTGTAAVAVGARAEVRLAAGRTALLAYRLSVDGAAGAGGERADAAPPAWLEPLEAWMRRSGLAVEELPAVIGWALPRIDGVPVFAAGRASVHVR